MKQALHIFRKDVRALWIPMMTVLGLHALYCVLRIREQSSTGFETDLRSGDVVAVLLVLGWFSVIAAAVHEEAVPGVRQFWLTRPYRVRSLIAAKLLLCSLVINIPLLVSDMVLLTAHGLPVSSAVPLLLARQAPNAMTFIAPALVLAAITSSAAGFWASLFGAIVLALLTMITAQQVAGGSALISLDASTNWWPWVITLLAGAGVFIVWQYRTRITRAGRVTIYACILALPLMQMAGAGWRRWLPMREQSLPAPSGEYASFDITPDLDRAPRTGVPQTQVQLMRFDIPVMIEGLGQREDAQGYAVRNAVELAGKRLNLVGSSLQRSEHGYWLVLWTQPEAPDLFRSDLSTVTITLRALVRSEETLAVLRSGVEQYVPRIGRCRISSQPQVSGIICIAGPREPGPLAARLVTPGYSPSITSSTGGDRRSDWDVIWGVSPLKRHVIPFMEFGDTAARRPAPVPPEAAAEIIAYQTRAQFDKEIRLSSVLLASWQTQGQ